MKEFVHLHNHTHYSLLDGACTPQALVYAAKDAEMPAVALTDHGNMFGILEFYLAARKAGGIKAILGYEAYIALTNRFDRTQKKSGSGYYHLTLLARNFAGYKNLIKLASKAYIEGFYYKPRIDWELLEKHSEGLIGLSGCLKSEVVQLLLNGRYDEAKMIATRHLELFHGDYFIELQDHYLEDDKIARPALIKLARELNIPVVASNDIHYIQKQHARAQEILLCINTGKTLNDPSRMKFTTEEMYFKSFEEMYLLFRDIPEALTNTLKVADLCNFELPLGSLTLPDCPFPQGFESLDSYVRTLAWEGFIQRYGEPTDELKKRLEYELSVISKMGFSGYFLVVKDFIDFARSVGIPVGPGRGSAAGSLVSYCLGITNLDPMKYDLIFERFLNPERISMPDIDIDFCYERRDEIIQYVIKKYGKGNVAQIITFGSMNARAVIRDVGRVMGLPYGDVDRIAKLIPERLGITLDAAVSMVPELKEMEQGTGVEGDLLRQAKVLEGTVRHASTHAAGVVISPQPLDEFVPLYRHPGGTDKENGGRGSGEQIGDITTQYSMKYVEEIGLLKMDFLGLRTLTVIHDTIKMLEESGISIDLDTIAQDDKKTYELFSRGETVGVFQFESGGMRDYLKKLKPECIEDLIAMNALYRPGPMDMIDDFIERKQGKKKIEYLHPTLEPILKPTYGVIVYQEQVIRIASDLGGFSLGKGDQLRRAMGKKIKDVMASQREEFIAGAKQNGIHPKISDQIFSLMDKFAGYGFNKSHAAGYAIVAYQTAYLKANYPVEFLAASLTSEMDKPDRVLVLFEEAKKMGITIMPPDVNTSNWGFTVANNTIRFGLGAIKNVGKTAVESLINARSKKGKFQTVFELCDSVDLRLVNKKVLESLIVSGAADSLEGNRAQKMAVVELALSYGQSVQLDKERGQGNLFESAGFEGENVVHHLALPELEEWSTYRMLTEEKELLGFYVSGHPLSRYEGELQYLTTATLSEIPALQNNTYCTVGGIITGIRVINDRNNNLMAFVTLEDFTGTAECIVFAEAYQSNKKQIFQDNMILVSAKLSCRKDEAPKLICEEIIPLEKAYSRLAGAIALTLNPGTVNADLLNRICDAISMAEGEYPLLIDVQISENETLRMRSKKYKVSIEKRLVERLQEIIGEENVHFLNLSNTSLNRNSHNIAHNGRVDI